MCEKLSVGAQVPQQMKTEIIEAVKKGRYMNESDLVRTAIRNLLDQDREV